MALHLRLRSDLEWVKVAQSCLTLCNPMDYTVHGILQARILEWVAFPFSGDLPNSGIKPRSPALQADSWPWVFIMCVCSTDIILTSDISLCVCLLTCISHLINITWHKNESLNSSLDAKGTDFRIWPISPYSRFDNVSLTMSFHSLID